MTQAVLTEPHGLPHGEDRFHKVRLPAAQTDGTAEIAEQIPLLLNFLLDFGKALLQRYGPFRIEAAKTSVRECSSRRTISSALRRMT